MTTQTSAGVTPFPGDAVAAQFGEPRIGTDNDFLSLETPILRLSDGEEAGRQTDLPRSGGTRDGLMI